VDVHDSAATLLWVLWPATLAICSHHRSYQSNLASNSISNYHCSWTRDGFRWSHDVEYKCSVLWLCARSTFFPKFWPPTSMTSVDCSTPKLLPQGISYIKGRLQIILNGCNANISQANPWESSCSKWVGRRGCLARRQDQPLKEFASFPMSHTNWRNKHGLEICIWFLDIYVSFNGQWISLLVNSAQLVSPGTSEISNRCALNTILNTPVPLFSRYRLIDPTVILTFAVAKSWWSKHQQDRWQSSTFNHKVGFKSWKFD